MKIEFVRKQVFFGFMNRVMTNHNDVFALQSPFVVLRGLLVKTLVIVQYKFLFYQSNM